MNGFLHCHTEESLHDSGLSVKKLVDVAIEKGATSVALTDHGTMTGILEFMTYINEVNAKAGRKVINGIPGVEAYVNGRHMVLLAKDYEHGYKALIRAVSESNEHLSSSNGLPQMDDEILNKYFGKNGRGHGYVVSLSGCVSGVLCKILDAEEEVNGELEKVKKRLGRFPAPDEEALAQLKSDSEAVHASVLQMVAERDALAKIAGRSYVKRAKVLASLKEADSEEYELEKQRLENDQMESKAAAEKVEDLKKQLKTNRTKETHLNKKITEQETILKNRQELLNKISALEKGRATPKELEEQVRDKMHFYQELFGKGNFFVELQYHRFEKEKEFFPVLNRIAKDEGIPCVVTNDIHIPDNSKAAIRTRQVMRFLRYGKYEKVSAADKEIYPKTDDELIKILSEIIPKEDAEQAMQNARVIGDSCDVNFHIGHHYPKFKTPDGSAADEYLRKLVSSRRPMYFSDKEWTEVYQKRLAYELDVICKMGYSDYHLSVQDFLNVGRKLGKMPEKKQKELLRRSPHMTLEEFLDFVEKNQTKLGYAIGPGRGSAAGSLVCYILGITNIDPIKYNLLFERFLNVERVSMPDIDSDISPAVRELVIEYIRKKYGENSVCSILTRGKMMARKAIRNAARFIGAEEEGNPQLYYNLGDEIAKTVPKEPKITLSQAQPQIDEYINSIKDGKTKQKAKKIVEIAYLVEGRICNYSTHAAGVVISDNGDVREYVPLQYGAKKDIWACQCDMMQVEASGLLKMDALGLKTLRIITNCIRKIKKNYGTVIDMDKIPFEKEVFQKIYAEGHTDAVFQVESNGMKEMMVRFKPDCIEDIILLLAAYRPGPMQYLDNIIEIKHGRMKAHYLTTELKNILDVTYCSIIYQEQVQQIFQKLAGYSLGQADLVRRAMSKKKEKVLEAERKAFIKGDEARHIAGCKANGIEEALANQLFDEMIEFARYAFNKSHSAAYAVVSYQTAWLKYHYPLEFLCATLNEQEEIKDLPLYIEECKRCGIHIRQVDINYSESDFSENPNGENGPEIIYGMGKVKGVKSCAEQIVEARRSGFRSFSDYMNYGHLKKDVTENLIRAGAFDSFCENRKALLSVLDKCLNVSKKIKDKKKTISEYERSLKQSSDAKEKAKIEESIKRTRNVVERLREQMAEISLTDVPEDREERLQNEFEVLGTYISSHPLDIYTSKLPLTRFADMHPGKEYNVMVLIENLRVVNRKSDGKPLAFFDATDKAISVEGKCFCRTYTKVKDKIAEKKAVVLEGKYVEEPLEEGVDGDIKKGFVVKDVHEVIPIRKKILLEMPICDWYAARIVLKAMETTYDEYSVFVKDVLNGQVRSTDTTASIKGIETLGVNCIEIL